MALYATIGLTGHEVTLQKQQSPQCDKYILLFKGSISLYTQTIFKSIKEMLIFFFEKYFLTIHDAQNNA